MNRQTAVVNRASANVACLYGHWVRTCDPSYNRFVVLYALIEHVHGERA